MEVLNIGANVSNIEKTTLISAENIKAVNVSAGKETIIIPAEVTISDMAFANADRENIVIYGKTGSDQIVWFRQI